MLASGRCRPPVDGAAGAGLPAVTPSMPRPLGPGHPCPAHAPGWASPPLAPSRLPARRLDRAFTPGIMRAFPW